MIGKWVWAAMALAALTLELTGCARSTADLRHSNEARPQGMAAASLDGRLGEEPDPLSPVMEDVYDKTVPEDVYTAD